MAAPGHPAMALLCERLSKQATATFETNSHRHQQLMDTLERTGPGLFTDVVNEWNDGGDHGDWGRIVVLPRSAFGEGFGLYKRQKRLDRLMRRDDVYVLHHFEGTWKPPAPPSAYRRNSSGGSSPQVRVPRPAWYSSACIDLKGEPSPPGVVLKTTVSDSCAVQSVSPGWACFGHGGISSAGMVILSTAPPVPPRVAHGRRGYRGCGKRGQIGPAVHPKGSPANQVPGPVSGKRRCSHRRAVGCW
jgi:hypothetical protein